MTEFVDFLLTCVKLGLLIFCANLLLALFSGTIFGSYFVAKKKFMKEINDPRFMVYEVEENKENEDD